MPPLHEGSGPSPDEAGGLDPRRRRARFRAWHRGTRELDLVMGRFADREMATLSEVELVQFEHLLDQPDPEVYGWITGQVPPPADVDAALLARLGTFQPRS